MDSNKKIKIVISTLSIIIVLMGTWMFRPFGALADALASIFNEDIVGKLRPLESQTISSLNHDDLDVSVVCTRNILSYSVYLHTSKSGGPIQSVFIAEKDTLQDCNQYIIEDLRRSSNNMEYEVIFRDKTFVPVGTIP